MYQEISLVPSFTFNIDSMCIGVIMISLVGLLGVVKGSRRMMNMYLVCVTVFIVYQGIIAVRGYLTGESWVRNVLDLSWNTAYDTDPELIEGLQTEFNCRGFRDHDDRSFELPNDVDTDDYLPPCSGVLVMSFGKRLQKLGLVILYIRLIQLGGVLLLSVLFKCLAAMDREDHYLDVEQKILSLEISRKDNCYFNEKSEHANEFVPLLSAEETDEEETDEEEEEESIL